MEIALRTNRGFTLLSMVLALAIAGAVIMVVVRANKSLLYGNKVKSSVQNQTQLSNIRGWLIATSIDADSDLSYEPLKEVAGNVLPIGAPYQTDPWGHSYRYCTWDLGGVNGNATYSQYHFAPPVTGLIARVISAGEDGSFATACTAVALLGDDSWVQVFNTDIVYGVSGAPSGWTFNGTDTSQSNPAGEVLITNGQITSAPVVNNDIVNKGYLDSSIAAASFGGATDCINLGPAVPAIGDPYCGGYYAGKIRDTNSGVYALVVSPISGQSLAGGIYKTSNTIDGVFDYSDGQANTNVVADSVHGYAFNVRALNINGYTDWYIPARDELELLYRNFKPVAWPNTIGNRNFSPAQIGENGSSIPPGAAYTLADPGVTTVFEFTGSGSHGFVGSCYWSSTEATTGWSQWAQIFNTGEQYLQNKSPAGCYVRAVRKVKISG